jgi:hypothetical protein
MFIPTLKASDITELKAFKSPPGGVKMVADALMVIDRRPCEWSEFCKATKSAKAWVQSMILYNKDNEGAHVVDGLYKFIHHQDCCP